MLCLPKHGNPASVFHIFSLVSLISLHLFVRLVQIPPGIDVDARLCLKQRPGRCQDQHDLEGFSACGRLAW
jgi:hypothetical protein